MRPRLPDVTQRLGLGVGLDLPWAGPIGFDPATGRVQPRVLRFLERHDFATFFLSWQPRSRGRLDLEALAPAWDALFAALPPHRARSLHHTALNLATGEPYHRAELLAFTNALCRRYDLRWVNEDLGYWSLDGKPLPYPLPPFLTDEGLQAAVDNVAETNDGLDVPLLVEFPGFSDGVSLFAGPWDAYDFFRELMVRTGSACTLDTGHLLGWRWMAGHRDEALLGDLDRLPLEHCFELHLSGCQVLGGRFVDTHHGILMDLQLDLLDRLLERCPNLKVVTYEDPKFDARGRLPSRAVPGFQRLRRTVDAWMEADRVAA